MNDVVCDLIDAMMDLFMKVAAPPAENFLVAEQWKELTNGVVSGIYNYLKILAIGLTIVYFLMEMNQKLALEGRDLNMKSVFAPFLKLAISFVVIQHSGKIVGWILSFNDTFIRKMAILAKGTTGAQGIGDAIKDAAGDAGFFLLIFVMLILLIALLVVIILQLVWGYKAVMYKLELLFRVSLLPIAVADVYNGSNSNAIRYIKGFLVLGIVGVSMVTLPSLAVDIAAANVQTSGAGIWACLSCMGTLFVGPFAAIAATGVVKQLAKEAIGA